MHISCRWYIHSYEGINILGNLKYIRWRKRRDGEEWEGIAEEKNENASKKWSKKKREREGERN